jgi:hypothetical protein
MADQSISQLQVAGALTGNEVTVVVQNGITKQVQIQSIADLANIGNLVKVSEANIEDITSNINTLGKTEGKVVYDTTNKKLQIATGSTAGSDWVDSLGLNPVTPT